MKWWKAVIAGGLFLGAAAITAGGLKDRPPPTVEAQVTKARKGSITRTITGAGKVQAATTVKISSNLSGDLTELLVKDGERVTNNRILDVLGTERDSSVRRAAWAGSKQIGARVAAPLREWVRRRNAAARELGFRDAYAMDLHLQEIDEAQLFASMDALRDATDAPYRAFLDGLEEEMSARFGVAAGGLRPWHWEDFFGQEAPSAIGRVDLDAFFAAAQRGDFEALVAVLDPDVVLRSDQRHALDRAADLPCRTGDEHAAESFVCGWRRQRGAIW